MPSSGVYAAGEDGRPEFHQLPAPEDEDVLDTTEKILECFGLPSRAPPLAPGVSDFNWQMDSF